MEEAIAAVPFEGYGVVIDDKAGLWDDNAQNRKIYSKRPFVGERYELDNGDGNRTSITILAEATLHADCDWTVILTEVWRDIPNHHSTEVTWQIHEMTIVQDMSLDSDNSHVATRNAQMYWKRGDARLAFMQRTGW